jgi:hypothetical protein
MDPSIVSLINRCLGKQASPKREALCWRETISTPGLLVNIRQILDREISDLEAEQSAG